MSMAHEYYTKAKTAVFWDLEGCKIPDDLDAVEVSQKIRVALEKLNYCGETAIYAYGDTKKMEADLKSKGYVVKQHAPAASMDEDYRGTASIYASGDTNQINPAIVFNHIPEGDPERSIHRILTDFFCWALDNPSPANLLLIVGSISGHKEFVNACHFLNLQASYNLIYAQPQNTSARDQLPSAPASAIWVWENLSVGGDPMPKQLEPKKKKFITTASRHIKVRKRMSFGKTISWRRPYHRKQLMPQYLCG